MSGKIFAVLIIAVALFLATASFVLPTERLHDLSWMGMFFRVMLHVLGVGALIKYLCTWK